MAGMRYCLAITKKGESGGGKRGVVLYSGRGGAQGGKRGLDLQHWEGGKNKSFASITKLRGGAGEKKITLPPDRMPRALRRVNLLVHLRP